MAVTFTIPGNLNVQGTVTTLGFTPPAGSVTDNSVSSSTSIAAGKIQHAHRRVINQGSSTTAATTNTQVIHVVVGATGTVQIVGAGAITPAVGTDTCTVDVKKNGTSILGGVITLNNTQTARQVVAGAITSPACVVGDVFEVVIVATHSSGTLPAGVFVVFDVFEAAQ